MTDKSSKTADTKQTNVKVEDVVKQYMTAYALHEDFEYFLSFYAENATVEDVVRGKKARGKTQIRQLFNWDDPKLSLGSSVSAVVVEDIHVFENTAVVSGYFMPFNYDGLKFGPWRMSMHLTFNQDGKIHKQVDWINYTPKVLFSSDADSNLDIKIPNYLIK
ncbi:nuclear transport factor 2 family protein [Catenovulum agarivorans]|uniref:nuclear transport factor 2 family protein n=1 Tax=Catenovulum agarivorans TaxID=1172192 RepID=UPI001267D01A|nr:nuclear transport factor 2 family protein [Catenovulum agarivorans]